MKIGRHLRTIRGQLLAITGMVCTAMLVIAIMLIHRSHLGVHRQILQDRSRTLASDIAGWLAPELQPFDPVRARTALQRAARVNPYVDLFMVDPNGKVQASSAEPKGRSFGAVPPNLLERLSLQRSGDGGLGVDPGSATDPVPASASFIPSAAGGSYLYVTIKDDMLRDAGIRWADLSWLAICWVVLAVAASQIALLWISRPLERLGERIDGFDADASEQRGSPVSLAREEGPEEVRRLHRGFARMADRIAVQVRALKSADEQRRELFASLSHDLLTPVTSISGHLETAVAQGPLPESERKRCCAVALEETHHLRELIGDILDLVHLESPQMAADREPFAIQELLETLEDRFRTVASARGVAIRMPEIPEGTPPLDADPVLVVRLFSNLVDNAIRFSEPGGIVGIGVNPESTSVTFEVSDDGPGVSADERERVFHAFYRGSSSRRRQGGTGLGLAIAKRIVEVHGGQIGIRPRKNRGSTFWVRLPLAAGGPNDATAGSGGNADVPASRHWDRTGGDAANPLQGVGAKSW